MVTRYAQKQIKDARNGNPSAQLWLGKNYLTGGEGMAKNLKGALQWLELAAAAGLSEAVTLIAENIPTEIGITSKMWAQICEQAAAQGSSIAFSRIGDLHERSDHTKSAKAFLVAAKDGCSHAAKKLGLLLASDQQLADSMGQSARDWLKIAAAAGEIEAIKRLSELLWDSDDFEVEKWLDVLARDGDIESMFRLGSSLATVKRNPEDVRRGAYWLERAARKGHPRAIWLYGRLHSKAVVGMYSGVPNSLSQAVRLLERAAALGIGEAYLDLARIYRLHTFLGRDATIARSYVEKAAHAGVVEAEYLHGRHLAKHGNDRATWLEAGRWLSRAASKGYPNASKLLRRISDSPPVVPEDRRVAQDQALSQLQTRQPLLAARLKLAATFGLNTRESLFLDPLDAHEDWCLKVDLSKHFVCRPWRLIAIESDIQLRTLEDACVTFMQFGTVAPDVSGETTKIRARQFHSVLTKHGISPALYVDGWILPK